VRLAVLTLILFGLDLAAISIGARQVPIRALWHGVGFSTIYLGCWWILGVTAPPRLRLVGLVLLSFLFVPVAWRPDTSTEVRHENTGSESHRLWSVTLGDPQQRLARVQPVTSLSEREYEVRVRLAAPYKGPARLYAAVNGVPVGELTWPEKIEVDQAEASARVPADALTCGPTELRALDAWPRCSQGGGSAALTESSSGYRLALLEVWQDRPDPALRIVTQRAAGGTTLGPDNSWFFDGQHWQRGVVDAGGSSVAPGLWHAFLAHGVIGL
jgi:hypothetical protein